MKSSRNILVILIAAIVLVACKKDKPFINPSPGGGIVSEWVDTLKCEDYPDSIYIHSNAWGRYQYRTPYFNPNNSNEFIYSYYDYEINTQKLIKYNIVTQQKLILASLGVFNQPKWNKNGWITFSNLHHVHVVKDDGSGYRQVSTQGQNKFPFWSGNDLYWLWSSGTGSGSALKQNINQTIPDTIGRGVGTCDIINNKVLSVSSIEFGNYTSYYGYFNLSAFSTFDINNFNIISECSKPTNGLAWDPSEAFFYASHPFSVNAEERGLFKITLTGTIERIMEYCESKRYSNISCSSDGKFLIAERTASKLELYDPYSGRRIQNSTIWLIDTETMEETKIDLE